jgi:ATP-dependent protease ClpP protease subunit
MSIPRLIVDKDIAAFDSMAQMFGESQPVFSANLVSDFLTQNKESDQIIVEVRSDGGSTTEAKVIYDLLKNSGKKITTEGYKVNSSAVIIFLAGENRLISENADFVIHPVWIDAYSLPWKLEAEDLQDFANEIKSEQEKLINIYVSVIGEDNREEVTQLMADSTNLTGDKAVSLGFATGKLSATNQSKNKRSLAFNNKMAEILTKTNQTQMNKFEALFTKMNNKIDKILNLATQNNSAAIDGGGSMYFDADAIADGVAVYSDEEMTTKLADKDYVMSDGSTVTVVDGNVSAIKASKPVNTPAADPAQNAEVTALASKVESIEANQVSTLEAVNKLAEAIEAQNATMAKFQNLVPSGKPNATPEKVTPIVDMSKMTIAQRAAHLVNKSKSKTN